MHAQAHLHTHMSAHFVRLYHIFLRISTPLNAKLHISSLYIVACWVSHMTFLKYSTRVGIAGLILVLDNNTLTNLKENYRYLLASKLVIL